MLDYLLQTLAFQFFFLLIYDVFLKKETFFNWNRFYLLFTAILSVILPFISIASFKNTVPKKYLITLPEITLGKLIQTKPNHVIQPAIVSKTNSISYWEILFFIGVIIAALIFCYKIYKIMKLIYKNPKYKKDNLWIVKIASSNTAFSFFNYVFLGENIKAEDKLSILAHEKIHAKQKHSLDLLFIEAMRIIFWFNPIIYSYQKRIATVHEFIADEQAIKQQGKNEYYQNLLTQIFQVNPISIVNPFFKQSLIKKRIVMLQKTKSKPALKLKYALVIPVVIAMLIYTSCSQEAANNQPFDPDVEEAVEKFRNQLQTQNSNLTKEERLELADYILDEFKANIEYGDDVKSGKTSTSKLLTETPNGLEVPFAVIDEAPIFPNCENASEIKTCFSNSINQHVAKNFNTKLASNLNLKGTQRIMVVFKINKIGNVIDIKARAAHPDLENEAIRVMHLLPKMTPGKHQGKAVIVGYGIPIKFQIYE